MLNTPASVFDLLQLQAEDKSVAIGHCSGDTVVFHGVEPSVHGVDVGEKICACRKQTCVLTGHEIFRPIAVLHQFQCLDKFLRGNLHGRYQWIHINVDVHGHKTHAAIELL
jgi:hypothetical protein